MDLIQFTIVENGWIFQSKTIRRHFYSPLEVFQPCIPLILVLSTTDLVNLYLAASGRHSSYCPSHSRSKSPAERRSARHHSQYYEEQDPDHQTQLQPQQVRERKHSPNCRRHEHNRRHRRQQQEQQKEQPEHHEGGGEQVPQSGVYSVDVEYGYNYTRVGGFGVL